jgi:hypothetical protein
MSWMSSKSLVSCVKSIGLTTTAEFPCWLLDAARDAKDDDDDKGAGLVKLLMGAAARLLLLLVVGFIMMVVVSMMFARRWQKMASDVDV